MLIVVMLRVIVLSVIMLIVVMLRVIVLSVIMLIVVMLCHYADCCYVVSLC